MNGSAIYTNKSENYYISFCEFISLYPNGAVYLENDSIKILLENSLFENCSESSFYARNSHSVVQQCNIYKNATGYASAYGQTCSSLNYALFLSIYDCGTDDTLIVVQNDGLLKLSNINFTRNYGFWYMLLELRNYDGITSFCNFMNNKDSKVFIADMLIKRRENFNATNYHRFNNFIDNKCEYDLILATKYYFENCIFDKNDVLNIFKCYDDNYPIYVVNSFVSDFSKEGKVIDVNITDDRNQYDVIDVVFVSQTLICSYNPNTIFQFEHSTVCQIAFQSIVNLMLISRRKICK